MIGPVSLPASPQPAWLQSAWLRLSAGRVGRHRGDLGRGASPGSACSGRAGSRPPLGQQGGPQHAVSTAATTRLMTSAVSAMYTVWLKTARRRAAEVRAGRAGRCRRRSCRRPCPPPSRPAAPSGGTSGCTGRPTMAGKVCRIQIPPSSCKLIANVLLSASTKTSAPILTTSETPLGDPGLLRGRGVRPEELLVDVAGEQVRRRDRHDRRRHQRADDDGREGDAGEPGREHLLEQQRHGQLGVGAVGLDRRRYAGAASAM